MIGESHGLYVNHTFRYTISVIYVRPLMAHSQVYRYDIGATPYLLSTPWPALGTAHQAKVRAARTAVLVYKLGVWILHNEGELIRTR